MDEMTKKFNKLTEELKSMFVVSQAMAKNNFNSTLQQPLRKQPCGCILCICDTEEWNRCLGCGAKMCEKHKAIGHLPNEDMVYEQPKAQPTEFTKRIRTEPYNPKWEHTLIIRTEDRDELCDRLDKSEASRKELLDACKELIENEPHGITPYFDKALRRIEAAISNAGG